MAGNVQTLGMKHSFLGFECNEPWLVLIVPENKLK